MAAEENIKVAVRLRPFLSHVKDEANRKRVIRMDELSSSVSITNPSNSLETHKFQFDNILWSFDGYVEQADGYFAAENKAVSEEIYCDQKQVYEDIAKEKVQNLWNGRNSTLLAVGGSRSGKSWTLLGLGANKGIVPQALTDLFKGMRDKDKNSVSPPEVRLSMAEIYNERVKDLLPSTTNSTKFRSSVKIREHSKKGFYIDGLRSVLIVNHDDIQQRLEEGLMNRAVFYTNVNGNASNGTTMITLTLVQKLRNHRGDEVTRTGTLEFIDLPACGEVTESNAIEAGADRHGEDIKFHNGIDSFVKCVDSLLEASIGKRKDGASPFYGHAVPKLLRNAVTGNSSTSVIVTLSPSDSSYQTSLFALQLAEKVRMLTTRPIANEEVTSKLTRELKGDNDQLRKLITLGDVDTFTPTNQLSQLTLSSQERELLRRKIVEDMKAQIRENDRELKNLQQPLEERLKSFKIDKNDLGKKVEVERKTKCHLFNLNRDSQISGKIIYIIPLGTIDFGQLSNNNGKGKENHFISFCGPGVREHHGTFTFNPKDGKVSIKPTGSECRILMNETEINFDTSLTNNDRIIIGGSQIWIYQNPKETWLEKYVFAHKLQYEYVIEELAVKSEFYRSLHQKGLVSDNLQRELIPLLPALEDAKAMAEDLNQSFTFQSLFIQPIESLFRERNSDEENDKISYSESETLDGSKPVEVEVIIKVQNTVDGTFSYWSVEEFYSRSEILKDSFAQYLEDGDAPLKEVEAFKERADMEVPIGYSAVSLKPLAHMVNVGNPAVPILAYSGFQVIGTVSVSLFLCNEAGEKVEDSEVFLQSPEELIDEKIWLTLSIQNPTKLSYQFKDIYCKYKFLDDVVYTSTKLDSKGPNFIGSPNKHERTFSLGAVSENILNILLTQFLVLRFYGKQRAHKLLNLTMDALLDNSSHILSAERMSHPIEMERAMAELKVTAKREDRHQRRLKALKALVDQSESLGEEAIPVTIMKTLIETKSQKHVDQQLEEHREALTAPPVEPEQKLPPELKALKRFSEVCTIC